MSARRVVVIGAGVNGLVAAALLAKRGLAVDVLEARDVAGGLAAGEEFHPGYRTAGVLHDAACLRPAVVAELELERHGLAFSPSPPDVLAASPEGPGLLVPGDAARARDAIAAVSAKDADAYVRFRAFLERTGPAVASLLDAPPPDPNGSAWQLAKDAWGLRGLGAADRMELLRVAPMCVADWLNEWFGTPALSCTLAMPALLGGRHGPWAPSTAALLLRHEALAGRAAARGPAAIVEALLAACAEYGAKVHRSTRVASIRFADGRVCGVVTEQGDDVDADAVLATCDPKTTVLRLIPRDECPPHLADALRVYRAAGTTAKVNLALGAPLVFAGREGEAIARACTGTSFDGMERAFDPVKYGRSAEEPLLDIHVPSVADPSCAPEGHAVVSVLAHAVAAEGEAASTDAIGDAVVEALARVAPGVRRSIVAREVLGPAELERRHGLWGGDLQHGEHGLDQLAIRPARECARHATPWPGLFLGGSGSWPGGGLTGSPGRLAARALVSAMA
jgi:phytoene dehydrogenase-like protein